MMKVKGILTCVYTYKDKWFKIYVERIPIFALWGCVHGIFKQNLLCSYLRRARKELSNIFREVQDEREFC